MCPGAAERLRAAHDERGDRGGCNGGERHDREAREGVLPGECALACRPLHATHPHARSDQVRLEVIPAYGDPNGSHVTITVVSKAFEGKRPVQRQQLVYKVIWEEMQGAVHAVDQMTCKTPEEAGL